MRLQSFIEKDLILEKVSKKDISHILNSDDVIVGAEFEFIAKFLETEQENHNDMWDAFTDAQDACYEYNQQVADWEDEDEKERGDPPSIPREVTQYDDSYSNYSDGDEIPEPIEPPYVDITDEYAWRELVNNYLHSNKPPFGSDYEVYTSYGNEDYSEWIVEPDGSLGDEGIEIKSPPLPLRKFVEICPKMFDWIDEHGYTDERCGFHIHMSLKEVPDLVSNLDLVKLSMFTDEHYIYKFFPNRMNNTYTESMKAKLMRSDIVPTKDDWKEFIDYKKLVNKVGESHYNAINWEGLSDDNEHIEFRYMGGANYQNKWNNIKTIIAQYAYNLDLACNPQSHLKEYSRKIQRMINKVDMARYSDIIGVLAEWSEKAKIEKVKQKVIDKYLKIYTKKFNDLKSIYGKSSPIYGKSVDVHKELKDIRMKIYSECYKNDKSMNYKAFCELIGEPC